jgi:oxygen-independent coproporphyrinogen-3 oxidase
LTQLETEIKQTYKKDLIDTIYIGGGTPSILKIEDLEELLKLTNIFKKNKLLEFTIEVNSEDITLEKALLFKKYGINRVSIGVQTFNKKLGSILERYTSYETLKEAINILNKVGIKNINLDLMYAIPGETMDILIEDLNKILSLPITHVSAYSLILEEHTKLYLKNPTLISDELDSNMYFKIIDILENNGFKQYETSNYSKDGYQSKHNLTYWNNDTYYGFGLGASSYIENIRKTNTFSLNSYLNGKLNEKIEVIDKVKNMEYEMILGLRKREGVSILKFNEKFNENMFEVFSDIETLINKGDLDKNNEFIMIPKHKLYLANEILISFILD